MDWVLSVWITVLVFAGVLVGYWIGSREG